MNREFRFRAWDNNQMYLFAQVGAPANPAVYTPAHWRECTESAIIMQFTGFKIKGIDLFESDIVREETPTDGLDEVKYAVVTWIKEWGMWACLLIEGEYQEYLEKGAEALDETMFWTFPIENINNTKTICGNIYQNPELLKTEK